MSGSASILSFLRLAEGMPMISRSDGKNFHLLLADRPLPYPAERNAGPVRENSVLFWYSSLPQRGATCSSLVLVPAAARKAGGVPYRDIEFVIDLLSEELICHSQLARMYGLAGNSLRELNY